MLYSLQVNWWTDFIMLLKLAELSVRQYISISISISIIWNLISDIFERSHGISYILQP